MDDDPERDEPDRRAILRRRNRLIALALSGAAIGATACEPTPCLDPVFDAGPPPPDSGPDGAPVACLSVAPDSGPLDEDGGTPPDASS